MNSAFPAYRLPAGRQGRQAKSAIRNSKSLFSSQPANQSIDLCGKIRNHDDQNHQQKRIRIDDP